MKKLISTLYLMFSISLVMLGQDTHEISLTFDKEDFNIIEDGNGRLKISALRDVSVLGKDTLQPALPYIGINVLVRPNEDLESFTYTDGEILLLEKVTMALTPKSHTTNSASGSNESGTKPYANKVYPNKNVEYTGTHLLNGYKFISFVICPFKYDATNGNLYLKRDIQISAIMKTTIEVTRSTPWNAEKYRKNIEELVYNKSDIDAFYGKAPMLKSTSTASAQYDYVIVTNETLKPAFQKLANWKTIKGIRTKVLTVSEIDNEYSGASQQLRIKNALADYYYSHGLQYALLGGSTNVVPAQTCYLPPTDQTPNTTDTPADIYYACFDNDFSWDANGNHVYGEFADNIDMEPEITVTRIPVSTLTDAETIVERIISYEANPDTEDWTDNILTGGNVIENYYGYTDIISDSEYRGDNLFQYFIQPNWTWCERFKFYDTHTDHSLGANYDFTANNLQTELEKGYTFADINCHGGSTYWGLLEDHSEYDTSYAASLSNHGKTVITTSSCGTNGFDLADPCLSDALMRNPNSGILAYLGTSRENWDGTGNSFNEQFYKALLQSSDLRFGPAVNTCKNKFQFFYTWGYSSSSLQYWWVFMSLNPIGDPEMPVFISKPMKFENVSISLTDNQLSVSTGLDDCTICISSANDNGESRYQTITGVNGHTFSNIDSDYCISVTKTGYIPYIARIAPQSMYLQDETFGMDINIYSNDTFIGSDVTSDKSNGPVTIESGAIHIHSSGDVLIKNDFDVKQGAEFEITNN